VLQLHSVFFVQEGKICRFAFSESKGVVLSISFPTSIGRSVGAVNYAKRNPVAKFIGFLESQSFVCRIVIVGKVVNPFAVPLVSVYFVESNAGLEYVDESESFVLCCLFDYRD